MTVVLDTNVHIAAYIALSVWEQVDGSPGLEHPHRRRNHRSAGVSGFVAEAQVLAMQW